MDQDLKEKLDARAKRVEDVSHRLNAEGAYKAYAAVTDNKNFRGEAMPTFDELPEKIQQAWIAAAKHVWDEATLSPTESPQIYGEGRALPNKTRKE